MHREGEGDAFFPVAFVVFSPDDGEGDGAGAIGVESANPFRSGNRNNKTATIPTIALPGDRPMTTLFGDIRSSLPIFCLLIFLMGFHFEGFPGRPGPEDFSGRIRRHLVSGDRSDRILIRILGVKAGNDI